MVASGHLSLPAKGPLVSERVQRSCGHRQWHQTLSPRRYGDGGKSRSHKSHNVCVSWQMGVAAAALVEAQYGETWMWPVTTFVFFFFSFLTLWIFLSDLVFMAFIRCINTLVGKPPLISVTRENTTVLHNSYSRAGTGRCVTKALS